MNIELEKQLVEKYPKILKDYRGDCQRTCMAWGMEHGDGWYKILDKLMERITYFCDLCSEEGRNVEVTALQIKEKFGELRFYYHVENASEVEYDIISSLVSRAESMSRQTCEISGKSGARCSKHGWIRTLSEEVAKELGYKFSWEQEEDKL